MELQETYLFEERGPWNAAQPHRHLDRFQGAIVQYLSLATHCEHTNHGDRRLDPCACLERLTVGAITGTELRAAPPVT